jgi:hypothetical protein
LRVNSFVYLFSLLVLLSCCHTNKPNETAVIKNAEVVVIHPASPSLDSLKKACLVSFTDLEISTKTADRNYDSFSFNQLAFSGWACQTFEGNAHKYKFNLNKNGKSIRKVAYFVNEKLDSDLYSDWSLGYSSERVWLADGNPYSENYFSTPGTMHGLQRKWFTTSVLAKETLYNHGVLVYEIAYNKKGEIIASKGKIPRQ